MVLISLLGTAQMPDNLLGACQLAGAGDFVLNRSRTRLSPSGASAENSFIVKDERAPETSW